MRGRGLKLELHIQIQFGLPSPLMRGRGLKLKASVAENCALKVAPHAGAWIET